MNINELFEEIQDDFHPEELKGEFLLQGDYIIWSYNLDENSEEIKYNGNEDDDNFFYFEASSSEELLKEVYQEDLEKLQDFFDEKEQTDLWTVSDFEATDTIISFKIF